MKTERFRYNISWGEMKTERFRYNISWGEMKTQKGSLERPLTRHSLCSLLFCVNGGQF